MADWEREIQDDRPPMPAPSVQPAARPAMGRLGSKQRRQLQQPTTAADAQQPAQPAAYRPAISQRPRMLPEEDPFAAHDLQPSPPSASANPAAQPFVHPLMAEPFRPAPQQRDPNLQRIESTLRDTLSREPSSFSSQAKLPPLSRPAVPPLRLGDVVKQVLGPQPLTNPAEAPSFSNQTKANLREKVAKMRLHETINPALAPTAGDPMAGLEPDRAGYLDTGATIEYDENDEDDNTAGDAAIAEETRPLSPRKTLPTSRLPIDPDDLARKPDELRGAPVTREELMHFRQNQAALAGIGSAPVVQLNAPIDPKAPPKSTGLHDTYVESKTTGEFIRVRHDVALAAEQTLPRSNIHNIHEFDQQIDTILESVDTIQTQLSAFWLLVSGLLIGAALLQVYLIYLRKNDLDFLSYYSVLAGPSRKVIYVLLGFSVTLACWRFSLERHDKDRHAYFLARYHQPNSSFAIWMRNLVCASAFGLAFLLTLIMVPLDDYMETRWLDDPSWFLTSGDLPHYYASRIDDWYAMAMARLVFIAIGWLCIIHRFGRAEHHYLQLEQEKFELSRQPRPSFMHTANGLVTTRTSRGIEATGAYESGVPTARSSRVSSHLNSTSNNAAARMDASAMAVPPRR